MSTRDKTRWDEAAAKVALDIEPDESIARSAGVTRRALAKWKKTPEFQYLVAGHREKQHAAVVVHGVADKVNRIARLDDTRRRLLKVIADRAADPSMAEVPGGETGLLVRQTKFVKVYEVLRPRKKSPTSINGEPDVEPEDPAGEEEDEAAIIPTKRVVQVEEFAIDTGALAELRAIELQAAKELGQIIEKTEHSGKVRLESAPDLSGLTDEELDDLERLTKRLADTRGGGTGEGTPRLPA